MLIINKQCTLNGFSCVQSALLPQSGSTKGAYDYTCTVAGESVENEWVRPPGCENKH